MAESNGKLQDRDLARNLFSPRTKKPSGRRLQVLVQDAQKMPLKLRLFLFPPLLSEHVGLLLMRVTKHLP